MFSFFWFGVVFLSILLIVFLFWAYGDFIFGRIIGPFIFYPFIWPFWKLWCLFRDGIRFAFRLVFEPNISRMKRDSNIEGLINALKHNRNEIRDSATDALGETGDVRAVKPLISLFRHHYSDSARCQHKYYEKNSPRKIILSLAKIGDTTAGEFLLTLLDTNFNEEAIDALGRISPEAKQKVMELQLAKQQEKENKEVESRKNEIAAENLLEQPVFVWSNSKGGFVGSNQEFVDMVCKENDSAISWYKCQNFVPIPDLITELDSIADYFFNMASIAQNSGIIQEAWAGYHQALRYFCNVQNDKMIGLTCFNLGKIYGASKSWEMAQLMFLQSAYLAKKDGEWGGHTWALYYLGDACVQLGNKPFARRYMSNSLSLMEGFLGIDESISSEDISSIKNILRNLSEE